MKKGKKVLKQKQKQKQNVNVKIHIDNSKKSVNKKSNVPKQQRLTPTPQILYVNPLPSYINNVIQNPVDVPQAVAIPQMVKNTPEYHTLGTIVESKKLNDKSFVPEKEVRLNSSGYIEPPSNSMSALINNDNGNDNDLSNENKEGLIKSFYEEYLEYNPLDNTQIMGVSGKWVKNNKQNVQKLFNSLLPELLKNKKD